MECPQGTCNGLESVKEHMITKSTIKWTVSMIVVPLILAFGIAWSATNARITNNTTTSAVVLESLKNLQKSVDRIESKMLTVDKVHEEITKRLKNHKHER